MREHRFGQPATEHANIPRSVHIHLQQETAFAQVPVARWKTPGSLAKQSHIWGAFFVPRLYLAGPKGGLKTDAARQGRSFLHPKALSQGNILPAPILLESLGPAEVNTRPFLDHESLCAQLAHLLFHVAFEHAHVSHHDDDGKYPHQHAKQSQGRAQFMSGQRVHSHAETLTQLPEKDGCAFSAHIRLRTAITPINATVSGGGASRAGSGDQFLRP